MKHRPPMTPSGRNGNATPFARVERELIVVTEPTAGLSAERSGGLTAAAPAEANRFTSILAASGATIRPLFDSTERRPMADSPRADAFGTPPTEGPDFSRYFKVEAPDEELDELAASLRNLPSVHAAYVKPPTYPAARMQTPPSGVGTVTMQPRTTTLGDGVIEAINQMTPSLTDAPPMTPNFTPRQLYLNAAPGGIDAVYAWTQPGGRGAGVRIVDVEGAWRFTHEDLLQNQGGVIGGTPSPDLAWRNHGTAVMGEIGGDVNNSGITGICPDANTRAISIFGGIGSAAAIRQAADALSAGDIILIELHRPGPAATGVGQVGFIAVEWWPDDFDAIRYATQRGVIVVEAAGNGAVNLDDPLYDVRATGFPASWSNPFRRGARDSGAILVGAGAPPQGTHGRDHGPDRSRLDFSNFGAAIDAQGWGREVTTTGYGDLQGGTSEDTWYTDTFSGTSSASPIIVGALGCVQGVRRSRASTLLTPSTARTLLRTTGSPQQNAPGRPISQRIGNRPNLRAMIPPVVRVGLTVPLFRYWNATNTDHFYTTNWAELGTGRFGWGFEGIQCYVAPSPQPEMVPLFRYWNAGIGDHFYTTNWFELESGRSGWGYEGVQCWVYDAPGLMRVPLYRYWNGASGDHFYTTNWSELGGGRLGYGFEGIQCYVAVGVRPPEELTQHASDSLGGDGATTGDGGMFGGVGSVMGMGTGPTGDASGGGAGMMGAGMFTGGSTPGFARAIGVGAPSSFAVGDQMSIGVPSTFRTRADGPAPDTMGGVDASFTATGRSGSRGRSITIRFDGDE